MQLLIEASSDHEVFMKFSLGAFCSCVTLLLGRCAFSDVPTLDTAMPRAPQGHAWKLVWHDEFDGAELDTSKWEIPPDGPRHALWWTPTEYIYYIDGRETWRINPGKISALPHYIKLSDETATWCKDISKAVLPDAFHVDYVRVYDCE